MRSFLHIHEEISNQNFFTVHDESIKFFLFLNFYFGTHTTLFVIFQVLLNITFLFLTWQYQNLKLLQETLSHRIPQPKMTVYLKNRSN